MLILALVATVLFVLSMFGGPRLRAERRRLKEQGLDPNTPALRRRQKILSVGQVVLLGLAVLAWILQLAG